MKRCDRLVTVCADCLCASCWHGEFMCVDAPGAGIVEMPESELRALKLEHPQHYSPENLAKVYGNSKYRDNMP